MPKKIKIGHSIMSPVVSDDGKTISFKPPQGTTYTNAESTDLKNAGFVYSAGVGMRAPNTQAAQNFLRSYAVDKTAAPVSKAKAAAKKASKPKSESGENKKAPAKKATTKKKEANDNGKKDKESNNVGLDKRRVSEPEKAAADNAQQEARNASQDQKAEEVENEKNKKAVSAEENIANGKKAIQKVIDTHETVENAMYREDVGNIDFVWGEEGTADKNYENGFGLAKIIKKHGLNDANKIPQVIATGLISKYSSNRVFIDSEEMRVVIRLDWDGKKRNWLLTGYSKNNKKHQSPTSDDRRDVDTASGTSSAAGSDVSSNAIVTQEAKVSNNQQSKKTRRQARQALKTALDKIMEGARQAKLPQKIISAWRSLLRARAIAYDPYDPARMFEEHPLVVRNNTKDFIDYAQSAWHGSPYKFDKFDLGKIGAGEGNQIYGWGLYFAQDRKISEKYYRDKLTAKKKMEEIDEAPALKITYKDGKTETVNRKDQFDFLADWTKADGTKSPLSGNFAFLVDKNMDIQATLDYFRLQLSNDMFWRAAMIKGGGHAEIDRFKKIEAAIKKYQEIITFLKSVSSITTADDNITASLYEVEIPDNDVLFDWGKTLENQPPKVREALRKLNLKHPPERYYVIEHDGQKYFIHTYAAISKKGLNYDWCAPNGYLINPHDEKTKPIVDALIEKLQEQERQGTLQAETVERPISEKDEHYLDGSRLYEMAVKKYGSL